MPRRVIEGSGQVGGGRCRQRPADRAGRPTPRLQNLRAPATFAQETNADGQLNREARARILSASLQGSDPATSPRAAVEGTWLVRTVRCRVRYCSARKSARTRLADV